MNTKVPDYAPLSILIIRLLVGLIFLLDGIHKLIPLNDLAKSLPSVRIPDPQLLGPYIGGIEMFCSFILVLGLSVRLITQFMLVIVIASIFSTKLPLATDNGFWVITSEGKLSFYLLFCLIFLLLYQPGKKLADDNL